MEFLTEFRDRLEYRKFRNNGHACTSIVVQINTDDEKDGFELFTGTMLNFRVLGPQNSIRNRFGLDVRVQRF